MCRNLNEFFIFHLGEIDGTVFVRGTVVIMEEKAGRLQKKIPDAACLATKVFFGTKSMERQRE